MCRSFFCFIYVHRYNTKYCTMHRRRLFLRVSSNCHPLICALPHTRLCWIRCAGYDVSNSCAHILCVFVVAVSLFDATATNRQHIYLPVSRTAVSQKVYSSRGRHHTFSEVTTSGLLTGAQKHTSQACLTTAHICKRSTDGNIPVGACQGGWSPCDAPFAAASIKKGGVHCRILWRRGGYST